MMLAGLLLTATLAGMPGIASRETLSIAAPAPGEQISVDAQVYDVASTTTTWPDFAFATDPAATIVSVRFEDALGVAVATVVSPAETRSPVLRRIVLLAPSTRSCGFELSELRPISGTYVRGRFVMAFEVDPT